MVHRPGDDRRGWHRRGSRQRGRGRQCPGFARPRQRDRRPLYRRRRDAQSSGYHRHGSPGRADAGGGVILSAPALDGLLAAVLAYRPFLDPLPYSWTFWPWLLLPLCAGVAIVYKAIKCDSMKELPRQSAMFSVMILVGLAVAAGILFAV